MQKKDDKPFVHQGLDTLLLQARIEGRNELPDLVGMRVVFKTRSPAAKKESK